MKNTREIGHQIETLAEKYLLAQGLVAVKRNYRCKLGEIDLIMRDGNCLVFIEVRFRSSSAFCHPVETINRNKQRKLTQTANYFLQKESPWQHVACRFDVVTLLSVAGKFEWIKDAF